MIADMLSNKKLENQTFLLFLLHNLTHYFVMKIPSKQNFQQIASKRSLDIDIQDLMKSVLRNRIIFWLLILLLHQINLHVSERIF